MKWQKLSSPAETEEVYLATKDNTTFVVKHFPAYGTANLRRFDGQGEVFLGQYKSMGSAKRRASSLNKETVPA